MNLNMIILTISWFKKKKKNKNQFYLKYGGNNKPNNKSINLFFLIFF